MLSPILWAVDERELEPQDWACNTALGGHDQARVSVPEDLARDLTQGQVLRGFLPAGAPIWEGELVTDPTFRWDGVADLDARGFKQRLEQRSGRLLYLTKDYGLWSDASAEPYSFTYSEKVQVQVLANELKFVVDAGQAQPLPEPTRGALALWAPNTPGGITRYAATLRIASTSISGAADFNVSKFTGPQGTRNAIATHTLNAGTPIVTVDVDQTVTNPEDAILIEFNGKGRYNGSLLEGRVTDLRVNGIAVGDTMSAGEVIADIASRADLQPYDFLRRGLNVLPLDIAESGSWAEAIDYLATIDGGRAWLVLDGNPPAMYYRSFFERVYDVRIADGVHPTLRPLPRYNFARIIYPTPAGTRDVLVRVQGSPLPDDVISVYTLRLADSQKDSAVAEQVAAGVLAELPLQQYEGSLSNVTRAWSETGGEIDPYLIEPGSHVRITDWGPMESRLLRVVDNSKSPGGCVLGISSRADVASLLARREFFTARQFMPAFRARHPRPVVQRRPFPRQPQPRPR